MRRFRFFALLLLTLMLPLSARAQQGPPDYAIRNIQPPRFTETEVTVQFDVVNIGGNASAQAADVTAILFSDRGEAIAQQPIQPLEADGAVTISLAFPIDQFPAGSTQSVTITLVGLERVEAPIPETEENNRGSIGIPIPVPGSTTSAPAGNGSFTPIIGFELDLSNPIYIGVLAGLVLAGIFLIIILVAIFRIIFQRPAAFGQWQPPYASTPFIDPNTTVGRRQGWQQHAQNDLLPPPPSGEGATHIRKLLNGRDGTSLGNWRITALRLNQYDQYGRITRSQYIAPGGLIRRLNRVIKQAPSLNIDDLSARIGPIASALTSRFLKRVIPRSATLPVALDIRLQGTHGEVSLLFELFYVQGGMWRRIDQWEPEIAMIDKTIDENLTYTLYGLRPGEVYKSFPQRLQADLTRVLVEMLKRPDAQRAPTPGGDLNPVPPNL